MLPSYEVNIYQDQGAGIPLNRLDPEFWKTVDTHREDEPQLSKVHEHCFHSVGYTFGSVEIKQANDMSLEAIRIVGAWKSGGWINVGGPKSEIQVCCHCGMTRYIVEHLWSGDVEHGPYVEAEKLPDSPYYGSSTYSGPLGGAGIRGVSDSEPDSEYPSVDDSDVEREFRQSPGVENDTQSTYFW